MKLQPVRNAFLWYYNLVALIWVLVFGFGTGLVVLLFSSSVLSAVISTAITLFFSLSGWIITAIARWFKANKERYEIANNKLIYKSGGIIADNEIEVDLRNVTLVKLKLPFIEHKLFGTGEISLETSGNAAQEAKLRSIAQPKSTYEAILKELKQVGFGLNQEEIIQQEQPSYLAVIINYVVYAVEAILAIGFIFLGIIIDRLSETRSINEAILPIILVAGITVIPLLIVAVFKFFDLKQRIYTLYSDTITYNEGFLTKHHATVPLENLADSETSQNLLQKLLGIYNVKISVQGVGQEVAFKNMYNGDLLEKNIDQQISKIKTSTKVAAAEAKPKAKASDVSIKVTDRNFESGLAERVFKMDLLRIFIPGIIGLSFSCIPILIFIVFGKSLAGGLGVFAVVLFAWIAGLLSLIISYFTNTYYLRENSVKFRYSFFTTYQVEFEYSKITSVKIIRGILDYLTGTASIEFTSIGSAMPITFKYIKYSAALVNELEQRLDVANEASMSTFKPNFNVVSWLMGSIYALVVYQLVMLLISMSVMLSRSGFVVGVILFLLLNVATPIAVLTYRYFVYSYSEVKLAEHYVGYITGLITRTNQLVMKQYINMAANIQYPLVDNGSVDLRLAGDRMIMTQNNQNRSMANNNTAAANGTNGTAMPNKLSIKHLSVQQRENLMLTGLSLKSLQTGTEIYTGKQSVANTTLILAIVFIFFPPLYLLLPLIILEISKRSYRLTAGSIERFSGLIFKTHEFMQITKIDYIRLDRGILNKLFNNGSVAIFGKGNSQALIKYADDSNYRAGYEAVKQFQQ